jgi:hypothetical protein
MASENCENYIHLYSSLSKEQKTRHNISILLKENLKKYITDWENIDEKMKIL